MSRRRQLTYSQYAALLGVEAVGRNGLPISNTNGGDGNGLATNELRRQNENYLYRENLGDFDTQAVYDPTSRYGVTYRDGIDLQQAYHESQTVGGKIFNGLGRLVATTGTKIATGSAFLAALPVEIARGIMSNPEGNFISRAADSGFAHLFEELETEAKEALPIFKSSAYQDKNIFQKAATLDFWMEDVVDGVAFALSSYVGGGAISKMGTGAKLATAFRSGLTKAAGRNVGQSGVKLGNIQNLARRIDKVTGTALMTSSEAMFEAAGVKKAILEDRDLIARYSSEDLKKIAAERARDTYLLNLAFIAPTNLFEWSSIYNKTKLFGKTKPLSRKAAVGGIENDAANMLVDKTKELTGVKAFLANPKTKLAGNILGNMAAEGLYEENIQYSIQKLGEYMGNYQDDPSGQHRSFVESLQTMYQNLGQNISGITRDNARAEAVGLGAAIGGGQSGLANVPKLNKAFGGDGGILEENKNEKARRQEIISNINDLQKNFNLSTLDIWERDPEQDVIARIDSDTGTKFIKVGSEEEMEVDDAKFIELTTKAGINPESSEFEMGKTVAGKLESTIRLDPTGNPKIDSTKLKAHLAQLNRMEVLDDIHQSMAQNPEANEVGLEMIRNEKLATMAIAHFRSGLGDLLMDKFENMRNAKPEELDAFGLTGVEDIDSVIDNAKQYVEALEEMYNSIETGLLPDSNKKESIALNNQRKLMAYDRAQRVLNIDSLVRRNQLKQEQIGREIFKLMANMMETSTNPNLRDKLRNLSEAMESMSSSILYLPMSQSYGISEQEQVKDFLKLYDNLAYVVNDLIAESKLNEKGLQDWVNFSPLNKLKADLERLNHANNELLEARKSPYEDYINITDQRVINPLGTFTNVISNIMTQGGILGAVNFDNIVPMRTKGLEYYSNNKESLFKRYSGRAPLTINLSDELSVEDYERYEARKLAMLKFIQKLQLVNRAFTGKSWKDFLSEGGTFGEMLKFIIANESILGMTDFKSMVGLIYERVSEYEYLKKHKEALEDDIEKSNYGIGQQLTDEELAYVTSEVDKLNAKMKEIEQDNDFDLLNPLDVVALLRDRLMKHISEWNENSLKRLIADEFKNGAKFVINTFNNNLEYDDVSTVEKELKQLINLKRIFKMRKDLLASPEFGENFNFDNPLPDFSEELEELITELKNIREEVIKRLNSKYRLELLSYKKYVDNLYTLILDPSLEDVISPDSLNKMQEAFEKVNSEMDTLLSTPEITELEVMKASILPETIAYAVAELENNPNNSNNLVNALEQIKQNIINQLKSNDRVIETFDPFDGVAFEGESIFENLEHLDPSNLARMIIEGLGERNVGMNPGFDTKPESSINKYQIHQDLSRLAVELEAEDRSSVVNGAPKEEILNIINSLQKLKAIGILTSSKEVPVIFEKMRATLEAQNAAYQAGNNIDLLPPSLKQRLAIQNILRFIYKSTADAPKMPGGLHYWAYLKGAAGTGKTLIVIKWVFKLLEGTLKPEEIITSGGNLFAAEAINKSVSSTNDVNTIDQLIEKLNAEIKAQEGKPLDAASAKFKIAVVDEIGAVGYNKLIELRTALDTYRTKVNPQFKVIVLGDPNQMTEDTVSKPLIEQYSDMKMAGLPEMTIIDPLIVRYRSDNPTIVNVQDAFINKNTKIEGVTGQINVPINSINGTDMPINGAYVENGVANLLGLIKTNAKNVPNRTRAIIVTNEEAKQAYQSKLTSILGNEAGNVNVLTYLEAQGMTIDEVYVDIPFNDSFYPEYNNSLDTKRRLYNKAMYTAASRGTQFIYIGNIQNSNTLSNPDMDNQVMENLKSKKLNYEAAIDDLSYQVDYYKMMIPDGGVIVSSQPSPSGNVGPATSNDQVTWTEEEEDLEEDFDNYNQVPEPSLPETETINIDPIDNNADRNDPSDVPDVFERPDTLEDIPQISFDNINQETPEIKEFLESHTKLQDIHPQSYAFDDLKYNDFLGQVKTASGLRTLFKQNKQVKLKGFKLINDRSNPNKFLFVLAKEMERDPSNPTKARYMIVSVLGASEYDKLPQNIKDSKGVELDNYDDINDARTIFTSTIPSPLETMEAVITNMPENEETTSHDMQVQYGDEINSLTGDRLQEIVNELGGGPQELDSARIRVFSRDGLQKWERETGIKLNMPITFGAPYLVIQFPNRKNPFLIRLTPKRINEKNYGEGLGHIREFIQNVKRFLEASAKYNLGGEGQGLNLGDRNFSYFISTMSNVYQHFVPNEEGKTRDLGFYEENSLDGKKQKVAKKTEEVLNTNHEHYGKLVKAFVGDQASGQGVLDREAFERARALFEIAHQIDTLVHGENVNKRQHKGKAQKAFDKIAKSNLVAYLSAHKGFIPLRDERIDESKSSTGSVAKKLVGRSLLGPINPFKAQSKYDINTLLGAQLAAYYKRLAAKAGRPVTDEQLANIAFRRFLDNSNSRVAFNVAELEELLQTDENGNSNINEGFGLRVPIQMRTINNQRLYPTQSGTNKVTSLDLQEHFEDNFKALRPIKMSIFVPNVSNQLPSLPSVPVAPVASTQVETVPETLTVPEVEIKSKETSKRVKYKKPIKKFMKNISSMEEILEIGTQEDYINYLNSIFPDSTLKDVVYHGTDKKFETFDKKFLGSRTNNNFRKFYDTLDAYGFNFEKSEFLAGTYGKNVMPVILNMKNPLVIDVEDSGRRGALESKIAKIIKNSPDNDSFVINIATNVEGETFYTTEYLIPDEAQIHVLGSQKDIRGFKDFMSSTVSTETSIPTIQVPETDLNLNDWDSLLSDTAAASNDIILNSQDFQEYYLKLLETDPTMDVDTALEYYTKCR